MRKLITLTAAAGLALALGACSKSEQPAPAPTETVAMPAEEAAPAATGSDDAAGAEAIESGDDRGNDGSRG